MLPPAQGDIWNVLMLENTVKTGRRGGKGGHAGIPGDSSRGGMEVLVFTCVVKQLYTSKQRNISRTEILSLMPNTLQNVH